MRSKAQGLSLNAMVIGGIVLIVLVVLIALFTGFFDKFTPDFRASLEKSCPADQIKAECDARFEEEVVGRFEPKLAEGKVCCRSILEECEGDDRFCATESGCERADYTVIRKTTCDLKSEICCKFR